MLVIDLHQTNSPPHPIIRSCFVSIHSVYHQVVKKMGSTCSHLLPAWFPPQEKSHNDNARNGNQLELKSMSVTLFNNSYELKCLRNKVEGGIILRLEVMKIYKHLVSPACDPPQFLHHLTTASDTLSL